jgi:hypothetical protein
LPGRGFRSSGCCYYFADWERGGEVFLDEGLAGVIEDVGVHGSGVEIDAAIESVLLVVDANHLMVSGVGADLIPLRGCRRPVRWLKDPR